MRYNRYISSLLFALGIFLCSSQVQAVAVSSADAVFYWDTLSINGEDADVTDFIVDTEVYLSNDSGDVSFIGGDSFDTFLAKSDVNVSATAGYDAFDDFYVASSSSDSIFSDVNPAGAGAISTVYVPFTADDTSAVIDFDYDLFASAEAAAQGETALAFSAIGFSLLDEDFFGLEDGASDSLFAFAEAGVDNPWSVAGFFDFTFDDLSIGDSYFLAIDSLSLSATSAVPEPSSVLLMALGLLFLARRKFNVVPDKKFNQLQFN